jgi:hypothetical protein
MVAACGTSLPVAISGKVASGDELLVVDSDMLQSDGGLGKTSGLIWG